jgi:hypothetical protein
MINCSKNLVKFYLNVKKSPSQSGASTQIS